MEINIFANGGYGTDEIEVLTQRLKQVRGKIHDVETQVLSVEHNLKAERRQYLELADIHKFQDIDQADFASVIREDKIETDKARNYRLGARACLVFGTLVSSGLSLLVFDFARPAVVFSAGVAASLLIGAIVVYTMLALIDPSPRMPEAAKTVKASVLVFGLLTLLSAGLFSWLRFMEGEGLLSLLSTSIAGFEIGIFGLTGAFECGERLYNWSLKSHETVEVLTARKKALDLEHADLTVSVQELDYRLKEKLGSHQSGPEVMAPAGVSQ